MTHVLGVDIGTTGMKMGVFRKADGALKLRGHFSRTYEIHTYNNGLFSDIDPRKWQQAFIAGCRHLDAFMGDIDVIALSGTTPGLTPMDQEGNALHPAILMLDQRSRAEARTIIDSVGLKTLLEMTGNMPVAGGCSLASILWLKNNHADLFKKTFIFGHCNSFMAKWLSGTFAMDPSSASLTALYNTAENNLTWNEEIARNFDLSVERLPPLIDSDRSAGRVTDSLAAELGLTKNPPVVIGGNDAVLAAYSLGIEEPGDIVNVNGTCEITLVCLPECIGSSNYNIRAHVIPERWLTLYVMNAGGTALEWFKDLFCRELNAAEFYDQFLPDAVDQWLDQESEVLYVPYLLGSRYSLEPLKAEFRGLTAETSREELLAALIRGLCRYQREHLNEIGRRVKLKDRVHITGGALNPAIIGAKKKWMRAGQYIHEEESSMKGAALLGLKYLTNNQ
jgi:sugar (pentulose or hexulose) kinase